MDSQIQTFLTQNSDLHLGGTDFLGERRHHAQVFAFHKLPPKLQAPIGHVEFTERSQSESFIPQAGGTGKKLEMPLR